MKEFLRKNIYRLLFISLVFNFIGFLYVARKLYNKFYVTNNFLTSNQYASILNYDSIPVDAEIDKTIILNTLADKFDYQSYLEIGQGKAEDNFDLIKCKIRIGVDPDPVCNAAYCLTSDDFFKEKPCDL